MDAKSLVEDAPTPGTIQAKELTHSQDDDEPKLSQGQVFNYMLDSGYGRALPGTGKAGNRPSFGWSKQG